LDLSPFSASGGGDRLKPELQTDLRALADAACDGALGPSDAARLEELLRGDPAAQRFYLALVRLDGCLRWEFGHVHPSSFGLHPEPSQLGTEVPSPPAAEMASPPTAEAPSLPIVIDISSSRFSPPAAFPFSVGSWLFSYAAATVISGVMLAILWTWRVSHDHEFVLSQPATAPPAQKINEPKLEFVGRISGLADCRLAGAGEPPPATAVRLGQKYAIDSGLMEISYQSGAKVILQGPCTYEVDSPASGFLSLGRLTARVEKSEISKSQILNPKFVVKTPTAVVTDLGTEFGVEVDRSGGTRSHVFQGKVELRRVANGVVSASAEKLSVGESVSVDAKGTVARVPATDSFVRDLRAIRAKAARRQREALLERFRTDPALVAYYAFDNERQAPGRLLNRAAATAGHLDGVLGEPGKPETRPAWTDGHAPGKRALRFDAEKQQAVVVPNDDLLNIGASMSVLARVKHRFPMPPRGYVILSRREYPDGYTVVNYQFSVLGPYKDSPYSIQLYTDGTGRSECGPVLPQREEWLYVAATQAPGYRQFFLNGRLVDQNFHAGTFTALKNCLYIGAAPPCEQSRCWFDGLIDEIWIFKRALSSSEIWELCTVGSPPEASGATPRASEEQAGAASEPVLPPHP
jgi:hypothetical protein